MKIKAMRGRTRDKLSSYLNEFMWKERYGKTAADCFNNMLSHIAQFSVLTGLFGCRIKKNVDHRCTITMIYYSCI